MKFRKKIIAAFAVSLTAAFGALATAIDSAEAENIPSDPEWMAVSPDIEAVKEGEFTLAVFGDTQKTIEKYPEMVYNSMDWLVENKTRLNLKYVISVGDIVDDVDLDLDSSADPEKQLSDASYAYSILKNAGVSFSLCLGNHDYEDMAFNDRTMDMFNEYFPLSVYEDMSTFGGSKDDTVENTYHYFEEDDEKYMILVLGHHPDDSILTWANEVVEANRDRQVIVVEHGYLDGGHFSYSPQYHYYDFYAGGYGGRTPQGDNIWQNFASKHENIFMVLCGHELGLDNKRIVRSDAYGENGNVVHQIMTNPADIEYGGAGLTLLLTFRNDGTIDANYYCPTFDKYYNEESQFTFDKQSNLPSKLYAETAVGFVNGESLYEDFTAYSAGDDRYLNSAYACGGLALTANGIVPTAEGSSLVYAFDAGEESRFRDTLVTFHYASESAKGGVALAISSDGVNYAPFGSVDGISQSARRNGTGYEAKFRLADEIYGNRRLYFKFIFLNGSVNNISVSDIRVETKTTQVTVTDRGSFGFDLDFSDYPNYEVNGWSDCTVSIHDVLVFDKGLGTGRADDYAGARGYVVWQFEAPQGATIDGLVFNASGRLTKKANTIGHDYALKLSYSTDGGKTYADFASENVSSKTAFDYDLSSVAKGTKEFRLKMTLWGDYWTSVLIKNISVSGVYRYDIEYHAGEGTNGSNPASYAASENGIALENASAPEYYSFVGWYDNAGFEGERLTEIPAGTFGKLDLYACYEPIRYNIIYDLGGGKNSPENKPYYEAYSGCELANPTRSGYTFIGWYESEDFSGEKVSSIASGTTRDVALYAKFLKNYRITYVLGGGELSEKTETFTEEDEVTLPVPTREGYRFVGWYSEKTFENKVEKIAAGTASAVTLYAKWEAGANSDSQGGGSGGAASSGGCNGGVAFGWISGFAAAAIVSFYRKRRR